MSMGIHHRQHSVSGRTCCICDRPCAIFDCQCLENFQHNTSEHGSLMKRLSAAFSMSVFAKDLHSFSLCCSCEHHLVVIEQANRIKECMKQVFLETREHRHFVSNHMLKHGKPPNPAIIRQKRLSSAIESRSFDEASPRVKKGRFGSSSSLPISPNYKPLSGHTSAQGAKVKSGVPISFDDSHYTYKNTKLDNTKSFDSVFLPVSSINTMLAPPDKVSSKISLHSTNSDVINNMDFDEK
ncbi:hypothetical protein EB796_017982 [Bugula neritina]|uniref:Uncharacterized protein n=1 Tax=Bugula neritina TaxID=10212 RepID=A0A7J7JDK4_BUGNE|nr:hypothetical protein EB796_017982 [Bugula neritina]